MWTLIPYYKKSDCIIEIKTSGHFFLMMYSTLISQEDISQNKVRFQNIDLLFKTETKSLRHFLVVKFCGTVNMMNYAGGYSVRMPF